MDGSKVRIKPGKQQLWHPEDSGDLDKSNVAGVGAAGAWGINEGEKVGERCWWLLHEAVMLWAEEQGMKGDGGLAKRGANCETCRGNLSREDASGRHRRTLSVNKGRSACDAVPPGLWTRLRGGKMNEWFPFYAYIVFSVNLLHSSKLRKAGN